MSLDKLCGVVTIYNISETDSETLSSIQDILYKLNRNFTIIVYNNSTNNIFNVKGAQVLYPNINFHYVENQLNPGLAVAYNFALDYITESKFEYLLLLDQDTCFSESYFRELESSLIQNPKVIVPQIFSKDNNLKISPVILGIGGLTFDINSKKEGFISAINSGSVFRKNTLLEIGKFNFNFPLDMLDHFTFKTISEHNIPITLLETPIFQNLSIHNSRLLPLKRYLSILKAEKLFNKNFDFKHLLLYKLRLVKRVFSFIKVNRFDLVRSSIYAFI